MTRDDDGHFLLEVRRRRRLRAARLHRRRRAGAIAAVVGGGVAVLVLLVTIGTGAALSAGCSLSTLRPVQIGQNSFLFAADGSRLGSIPAERNREPVTLARAGAVAAEGDGGGRGSPLLPARRGRLRRDHARALARHQRRQGRAGRLDDHPAARAEPLRRQGAHLHAQAQGGLPRDQAERPLVEGQDPPGVPQHRLLRQPRLRRRGGGGDVLLQAREPAEPPPGGAARGPAAGAVGLRPAAQPGRGDRPAERGAAHDARNRRDHRARVPLGDTLDHCHAQAGQHLHADPGAVLLLVRDRRARARLRREHRSRRRAARLHDDRAAAPARGEQGDPRHPLPARRPGRGDRLGRARHRRDPRDDRGHPRATRRTSSTSRRSRPASPARPSRPSCSPRRSSRGSTRTTPTTPRRRSRARAARGAPATTRRESRGR